MFEHLTFDRQNEQANRLFQRLTELKYGNDAHDSNNLIQVIKFYDTLVEVGEYENSTSGFLQYLKEEINLYEMDLIEEENNHVPTYEEYHGIKSWEEFDEYEDYASEMYRSLR